MFEKANTVAQLVSSSESTHAHTPGFCSVHLHPVQGSSFNFESMKSMMGKQMFDSSTADQIVLPALSVLD